MALEGQQVCSLIWDRLTADAGAGGVNTLVAGRIYRDRVPQTAALPAITITLVSHVDEPTLSGLRVFAQTLVDVRVVGAGSNYGPLNTIAERVDSLLQQAQGARSGVVVVRIRREALQAFVEDEAGTAYSHVIGTYRSEAYAA